MRILAQSLKATVAVAACAAGLVLASADAAQATTVYVRDGNGGNVFGSPGSENITINVNGNSIGVSAGAFGLQYSYSSTGGWTDFLTYCLEPDVNLNVGSTAVSGTLTPISQTAEYGSKATVITNYYNNHYTDSLTSSVKSAAFQVGLWELAYDTGSDLGGGRFRYNGSVRSQAETYLTSNPGTQPGISVIVRSSPDNQDLVVVLPGVPAEAIPEPATLALFGLGLAGLGLAMRRRARENAGTPSQA